MPERRQIVVEQAGGQWRVIDAGRVVSITDERAEAIEAAHERAKQIFATGQDSEVALATSDGMKIEHRYADSDEPWAAPL